ncbi:MAG: polyprenyl synthetase [Planctomycetaceae bacterium]|nr:polyprenyl synthetase [Planctomycetaceae bacterium]MCH2595419.1 polyprenyl synthetase family protein [Pirellulales bacterium]HCK41367.1 polyprenyl synthetase family protein [Planctomycetaceae bacterium]
MSSARTAQSNTRAVLAKLFSPIANDLKKVDHLLQSELRHSDPIIDEITQHAFRLGGKRLRPALLLLSAQMAGEVNDSHRILAAVVEMVHTATLVHDDVLDEATLRRHEDTINARWNNKTSILLGDFLFSHAFYLASTLETTMGCRTIGQATNIVCAGELRQTAASGDFDLTQESYFQIIDAKTAELTACCCKLGAYYANANEDLIRQLEVYGRHLGIAFQIADDLLDLEGEEIQTGKSLGTDLMHLKMTLPLIRLRDQLSIREQCELKQLIAAPNPENHLQILNWLESSDAIQNARNEARHHTYLASEALAKTPNNPAKESLLELTNVVSQRDS